MGKKFYSLDETSFGRHQGPVFGYSSVGQMIRVPKRPPRITTLSVLAIASDHGFEKITEHVGSVNSIDFAEFLLSCSGMIPKGVVILLDNVSTHHSKWAKAVAELEEWILFFTTPYNPLFIPVEEFFSLVKRKYYKSHQVASSFENSVTPSAAQNIFRRSLHIK